MFALLKIDLGFERTPDKAKLPKQLLSGDYQRGHTNDDYF